MDGWNTAFLLVSAYFQGRLLLVSERVTEDINTDTVDGRNPAPPGLYETL